MTAYSISVVAVLLSSLAISAWIFTVWNLWPRGRNNPSQKDQPDGGNSEEIEHRIHERGYWALSNVLSVFTTVAAFAAFTNAQEQLSELKGEQRAWIAVQATPPAISYKSDLIFSESLIATLNFRIKTEALGAKPALNVVGGATIMPWRGDSGALLRKQKDFCDKFGKNYPYNPAATPIQRTIFPKQTPEIEIAAFSEPGAFDSYKIEKKAVPAIVGCISYLDDVGLHHWTGFIYDLYQEDAATKFGAIDVVPGVISGVQLHFTDDIIGGGPAN